MKNENIELTKEQITAIKRGVGLGRTLQKDYPEIADLYRQGYTLQKIVEKLDIKSHYNVSNNVACSGVHRAITGYHSNPKDGFYDGLMDDNERESISRKHIQKNGVKVGYMFLKERKGLFGITPKQLAEAGRKGGHKAGTKLYREKRGIHGRTPEQHREDSKKGARKGGLKSAIARGFVLWTEEELALAYQLSQQPKYQYHKGQYKGKSNLIKIIEELTKRGYPRRTRGTISEHISKYRKSIENKV